MPDVRSADRRRHRSDLPLLQDAAAAASGADGLGRGGDPAGAREPRIIRPRRGCMGAGASRSLQNCLRGAVEASWVGSIPIHPRQIPRA